MKRDEKQLRVPGETEETLQITVPKVTKKNLKIHAAESGDPMRLIVLRASGHKRSVAVVIRI